MKDSKYFVFIFLSLFVAFGSIASAATPGKKEARFSLSIPMEESLEEGTKKEDFLVSCMNQQQLRCCKEDGTSCSASSKKNTLSKAENHRKLNDDAESVKGSTIMRRTEYLKVGIGSNN